MTWTQPVCDNRFREMYPGRDPMRVNVPLDEQDRCCFCGAPSTIYVRLDPATVPRPRAEA